jgi:hypothetical protein
MEIIRSNPPVNAAEFSTPTRKSEGLDPGSARIYGEKVAAA